MMHLLFSILPRLCDTSGMYSLQSETCKTSCGHSGSRQKEKQVTQTSGQRLRIGPYPCSTFLLRNPQLRTAGKKSTRYFQRNTFYRIGSINSEKIPEEAHRHLPVAWREKVDDVLHEAVNGALASN
jgi:hypothetical protein